MDIIIYIIFLSLACFFIIKGIVIWCKQKMTLINIFNRRSIRDEDIKGYTKSVGIAYILMGFSIMPIILIDITNNDKFEYVGFLTWLVGLIIVRIINFKVKRKYDTGIFK